MSSYKLEKLAIKNFRNIQFQSITFNLGINCIFGQNGNGKTNLLEAIYFISHKKSFRKNTSFPQILSLNGEEPEILFQSLFKKEDDTDYNFSGKLYDSSNEYYLNGKPFNKKFNATCLFINPFDSYAFFQTPGFRRKWVDQSISAINVSYKKVLNKYQQALKFRNSLLQKKPSQFLDQIKALDKQLAQYSVEILASRSDFLESTSYFVDQTFKNLFAKEHELRLIMQSKFSRMSEQEIFNSLQNNIDKELYSGRTENGVHRDDYILFFDGLNAFELCSLGQQKMSFLSLLFAYIELFKYKIGSYPIVLIDDVSGELDRLRWNNLIGYLREKKFQTFITTANEDFKQELEKIENANKFYIQEGIIKQLN